MMNGECIIHNAECTIREKTVFHTMETCFHAMESGFGGGGKQCSIVWKRVLRVGARKDRAEG
jgi:hypothetical protein